MAHQSPSHQWMDPPLPEEYQASLGEKFRGAILRCTVHDNENLLYKTRDRQSVDSLHDATP